MLGLLLVWTVFRAGESGEIVLEAESQPPPGAGVEAIAAALNPFVLTGLVSERLLLEVDWVEGYRPSNEALLTAESVLRELCDGGRRIDVVRDDEIPLATWKEHAGREGLERLVASQLDADPADWGRVEVVYVLYAPDSAAWYAGPVSGMTDRITFERQGRVLAVRSVLLFTDEIRRDASLWITAAKVERSTLVHELGHVMGLTYNRDHSQKRHPGHCSVVRCIMHRPGWRAAWVNGLPAMFAGRIPAGFGRRCTHDIEAARRMWSKRAARFPEFVRRLKSERLLLESRDAASWRALRGH